MHEKVEELLAKHEKKINYEDDIYYYLVMQKAGLLTEEKGFYPATKQEYDLVPVSSGLRKIKDDFYYVVKPLPLDLTAEETKAVESTLPKDLLYEYKLKASGTYLEKETDGTSGAATFFTVIAWLIWIGGLIIAIVGALSTERYGYYNNRTRTTFDFSLFITPCITYLLYGCFAMCAAELFKKLQTIVNLLKRKP